MAESPWRMLRATLVPHRRSIALFAVVLTIATAIPLGAALLLTRFIRLAIQAAPASRLVPLALAYAALGLVSSATTVTVTWRATIVAWKITNGLRHDLTDAVLRADLSFHRDRTPGELVSRVDADITAMAQFISSVVAQVIAIVALAVGAVIVATVVEPILAPALALCLVGVGLITYALRNRSVAETVAERTVEADVMSAAEQYLAGAEDVASLGAGRHGVARVGDHSARLVNAARLRVKEQMTMQGIIKVSIGAAEIVMIAFGALMARRGSLDIAGVVLGFRLVQSVSNKVDHLTWRLQDAQGASGAATRVMALMDDRREVTGGNTTLAPSHDSPENPEAAGGGIRITFESVSLVYDDETGTSAAVRNLDLVLSEGRLLGVVGRTGSGKTSVARLLLRLVTPTEGRITLDGVDLSTLDEDDLRRAVTAVPQDVQLFPGTVEQNVAMFAPFPRDAVTEALAAVGLGDWLDGLPSGLDTKLAADARDDGGTRTGLSAGQAQLLALSRALLRSPSVVVLDEATSRIDPTTQNAMAAAMRRLVAGRTALVIAHRLETLAICDDIAVLANGQLIEHGARVALAADPRSHYARLLLAGQEAEELS